MAKRPRKPEGTEIKTLIHDKDNRVNIPTAETENLMREEELHPTKVEYKRNRDLDPQLVWKGKDEENQESLMVDAVPIYVQEKIHPKAIINGLKFHMQNGHQKKGGDLFEDLGPELNPEDRVEFYEHAEKWCNRMILGDSLQVMTSLSEKEGLKGRVQCIYFDPPYGINFSSNWQPTTRSTRVTNTSDAEAREPEAIKAFRDTWSSGIHSYLGYVRDRLEVARALLTESGSFFLQIGPENMHLLRCLLDEVFGKENFVAQISFKKASALGTAGLASVNDYVLWYAKNTQSVKLHKLFESKSFGGDTLYTWIREPNLADRKMTKPERSDSSSLPSGSRPFRHDKLSSAGYTRTCFYDIEFQGKTHLRRKQSWATNQQGMQRLIMADRILASGSTLGYRRYFDDFGVQDLNNSWEKTGGATDPIYVVQTNSEIAKRCILMSSDPGDLVLDPTCGSGTTATVAEEYGRRWITIDTSRVALALARSRLIGCKYKYYLLKDSQEGAAKEQELAGVVSDTSRLSFTGNIQRGFVYKRCPHITLGSIAQNSEIAEIWERRQTDLEQLLAELNNISGLSMREWDVSQEADDGWPEEAKRVHKLWWEARIGRQQEIDNSIARNAQTEYLYDQPYEQKSVVRVTGPFTMESLSPFRMLPTDARDEELIDQERGKPEVKIPERVSERLRPKSMEDAETKFLDIVYEYLRSSGVQNTKKGERLEFDSLEPWDTGRNTYVQFAGKYIENGQQKKVAVCVGPEYGTVSRHLMVKAAREAADYFDLLVILGFAFEAHADGKIINVGKMPIIRARMNNDLHMADRLKSGSAGNLFVVFGEPDIELRPIGDETYEVEIKGVDIFDPVTGEVKASGPEDIACWFIDTEYNEEAFFVRHAYFSGGGKDPYKHLKRTLKAEISEEAWETLYSTVSRPFSKPATGRIAVKAINHFGDEVLKVFSVD